MTKEGRGQAHFAASNTRKEGRLWWILDWIAELGPYSLTGWGTSKWGFGESVRSFASGSHVHA